MGGPVPEIVQCPHCWADNPAIEDACQACGRPLAIVIGPRKPIRKFGIGSMMLLIAALAVCLAAMRITPGLGIFLLLIVTPALARTTIAAARRAADDRPMSLADKVGDYFVSLSLMLMVVLASTIAFVMTCVPVGFVTYTSNAIWFAVIFGAIVAIAVAFFLLRRFWPRKDC